MVPHGRKPAIILVCIYIYIHIFQCLKGHLNSVSKMANLSLSACVNCEMGRNQEGIEHLSHVFIPLIRTMYNSLTKSCKLRLQIMTEPNE